MSFPVVLPAFGEGKRPVRRHGSVGRQRKCPMRAKGSRSVALRTGRVVRDGLLGLEEKPLAGIVLVAAGATVVVSYLARRFGRLGAHPSHRLCTAFVGLARRLPRR